ncbi:hypothetical protein [Paenilisteria newyorkensis]|uniref:hypothetical protein n=1 Tax=Listeria newyorkensis TaxID=1497681 RepID=UPI000669C9E5|nr:hypothetical protein [Listeria newyorkensis]KMT62548.1 hypothetical protein X559_1086 [Listeria newyorkensis]
MTINSFLGELKKVMDSYEEDFSCQFTMEQTESLDFEGYEEQGSDDVELKYFDDKEYVWQMQIFEDYYRGEIIRKIKNSDYSLVIAFTS